MVVRVAPGVETRDRPRRRALSPRLRAAHVSRSLQRGALARWDQDSAKLSRTRPGRVLRWLYCGYQEANAGDAAAAIAYHALIALVPTFLLLVSVAGFFLQRADVLEAAIFTTVWALPFKEARDTLQALLEVRRNSGWFGLVSLVGFAWIGMGFVNGLTRGINRVYGVQGRHFLYERLRAFVIVVLFAVLFLIATLALALPSLFVGRDLGFYFQSWHLASREGQASSYVIGFLAAGLLFLVLYRILPNARQTLADVWPGTLVAAILFLALAQAFPIYLRYVTQTNRLAVVFGISTLVVLWFYLLAHVLLFGAYVNATYQRHRRRAARRRRLARDAISQNNARKVGIERPDAV